MGVIDAEALGGFVAVGELGLDGRIEPAAGVLLAALHASEQDRGLICPPAHCPEAAWAGGIEVAPPPDLLALINHLKGSGPLAPPRAGVAEVPAAGRDLKQVKGQEAAKRALKIAAAGGHNLLMVGPPGAGKSLLAGCLLGILPDLTPGEALEVSMAASVAGELQGGKLIRARPFRSPHHSASMAALTGEGLRARPGEVSLAHLGVLFLDELAEFQRPVLDSLRQPDETGKVSVARANAHVTFSARVQLIAAMNLCRCGHLGDASLACAPRRAADYQAKVSGPLLDRIDLHVEVRAVSADLVLPPAAEGSAEVAGRVAEARAPDRTLQSARRPHQYRGRRRASRPGGETRRVGRRVAGTGGRGDATLRAWLSPGAARGAHGGGSGRQRRCRARSYRRGTELLAARAGQLSGGE